MLSHFLATKENIFILFSICCSAFIILLIIFVILNFKKKREIQRLRTANVEFNTWRQLKEDESAAQKEMISDLMTDKMRLVQENERLKSDSAFKDKYIAEQIDFLEKSKAEMSLKFKDISNEVIRTQNTSFNESQKSLLSLMLKPFQDQLLDFKKKIEMTHDDNIKFDEQIKMLFSLNQNLSNEAENLANALKGNKKIQGNWGEFQLERVLEISGLEKGINYFTQETFRDENNKMFRPDMIVKLPNERQVIIDSKVSLNDYVAFVNADNEVDRAEALKKHISCIKKHIDELSSKEYQKLLKDQVLDYVMIFIPIEGAYVEAAQADLTLYDYALSKNIAITTPSSLLPLLRTIENLWQLDKRNKSAAELADIGGKIYDKLAGFVEDMKQIDKSLKTTHTHYENAMTKLAGKGGAISFALQLKEKGAKTSKNILLDNKDNNLVEFNERISNDE